MAPLGNEPAAEFVILPDAYLQCAEHHAHEPAKRDEQRHENGYREIEINPLHVDPSLDPGRDSEGHTSMSSGAFDSVIYEHRDLRCHSEGAECLS